MPKCKMWLSLSRDIDLVLFIFVFSLFFSIMIESEFYDLILTHYKPLTHTPHTHTHTKLNKGKRIWVVSQSSPTGEIHSQSP